MPFHSMFRLYLNRQEIPRGEQESIPMPVDPGFAPALGRRAMMGTGRGIGGGDDGSGNSPLDVNASGSWGRYNDDTVDVRCSCVPLSVLYRP